MTYSIVARDDLTGELGVAVQRCMFAVGSLVRRSDDPLGELARLLDAADAFAGFNLAVDQLFGGDPTAALETIDRAMQDLPGEDNLRFVRAGADVRQ